jgi:hypothetical protein
MKYLFNRLLNILSVTGRNCPPDFTSGREAPLHEKKDRLTFLLVWPDVDQRASLTVPAVVATDNDTLPDTRTSCDQPLAPARVS